MNPSQATAQHISTEKSLLDSIIERQQAETAIRYMPTLSVKQFSEREKQLKEIKEMLVEGTDYGVIPGTDKPTLLKPGAEKICAFFGYAPHYEPAAANIEDWNGARFGEPLFYYQYACVLSKNGQPVGEGIGSANSWESKYRYRWVREEDVPARFDQDAMDALPQRAGTVTEFAFAIDKGETSGPYGKPAEYWQKWRDAIDNGEARSIGKTQRANANAPLREATRHQPAGGPMTHERTEHGLKRYCDDCLCEAGHTPGCPQEREPELTPTERRTMALEFAGSLLVQAGIAAMERPRKAPNAK